MAFGILARRLGAGAWLLASVTMLAGCATKTPTRGSVHEGSVTLGNRVVPLPPGAWIKEYGGVMTGQKLRVFRLPNFQEIVLVQRTGNSGATGVITAFVNEWPAGHQEPSPRDVPACALAIANRAPEQVRIGEGGFDCRSVFLTPPEITPSGPVAPGWQIIGIGSSPNVAPTAVFAVADRSGQLQVNVSFNPESRGVPRDTRDWAQNAWNPENHLGIHTAYKDRLANWAEAAHPAIRAGFAGQVPPPLPPF